ncbi:hypothetical protein OUZ56_001252 [Daphnia magna]|uniref:Uncharacterized protein n=1 Tax=Daphnia magna TaxID=35525 RepID=A0ABR0A283_9CRUS|nr:hypothetical protein OUZ56_001252 [Daphnia magna]
MNKIFAFLDSIRWNKLQQTWPDASQSVKQVRKPSSVEKWLQLRLESQLEFLVNTTTPNLMIAFRMDGEMIKTWNSPSRSLRFYGHWLMCCQVLQARRAQRKATGIFKINRREHWPTIAFILFVYSSNSLSRKSCFVLNLLDPFLSLSTISLC